MLYGSSKLPLRTFVADERVLEGPEDLTGKTTAQIGFYTHRGQDGRGLQRVAVTLTPMHAMHMRAVEHTNQRGLRTHHVAWVNHTRKPLLV